MRDASTSSISIEAAVSAAIAETAVLSRRQVIGFGTAALSVGVFAGWMDTAVSAVSVDPAVATLATVARDMFPHRQVADSVFVKFAQSQLGVADENQRKMLRSGLEDLERRAGGKYRQLGPAARVKLLASLAGTEFFSSVRFAALINLYSDPAVVGLFGYEGASFAKGGYLARGYDDLRWLPDPE
jgi:hypothetical protein